jgi:hypothetical protein
MMMADCAIDVLRLYHEEELPESLAVQSKQIGYLGIAGRVCKTVSPFSCIPKIDLLFRLQENMADVQICSHTTAQYQELICRMLGGS